jgi:O-antigen/teichoic acid export membrane protein
MIQPKTVKNALVLMMATVGQKLIAFVAFAVVARLTGPNITGIYFFGVSVTSVFVVLSDLGMTPVVIRAIAGNREGSERLLSAAIRAKLLLIPVAVLASLGYGLATHQSTLIMATIAVACLVMSADALHLLFYGVLRGRQNLKPEALGMFIGQVLSATVAITAAIMGWGPVGLAAALLFGSVWNVLWAGLQIRRLGLQLATPVWADIISLSHQAVPFALAGMAVKVYSYVDSLMLQAFNGSTAVGYYAAAYKMTYAMQFLPLTFTAALYPALSAAWAGKEHEKLKSEFTGALKLMAAISFPIAAGLSALAPRYMTLFYGERFAGSIPAMQVLPWVLIPIFLDFPVGALLNGSNRAYLKTSAMIGTMVLNVILNAILVPAYGPLGAAWAGVFSFWFLYLVGTMFTYQTAGGYGSMMWIMVRAVAGAAVSYAAWLYVGSFMPFPMACLFGAAIAVGAMFGLKLITLKDVSPLWTIIKRKFLRRQETIHET